jgi:transposase-like protein
MELKVLQTVLEGKLSKSEAARKLGCSARTIGRKLEKLGSAAPVVAEVPAAPAVAEVPAPPALEAKLQDLSEQVLRLQQMLMDQNLAKPAAPKDTFVTLFADVVGFYVNSNTRCSYIGGEWQNITGSQVVMKPGTEHALFNLPYKAFLGQLRGRQNSGYWGFESSIPGGGQHYALEHPVSIGDCIYAVVTNRVTPIRYSNDTHLTLFATVELVTADRNKAIEAFQNGKSVQTLIVA